MTAIDNGDFGLVLRDFVGRQADGGAGSRADSPPKSPDFVAKVGARYGLRRTESNARFYTNGGCELLGVWRRKMRDEPFDSLPARASLSDDAGLAASNSRGRRAARSRGRDLCAVSCRVMHVPFNSRFDFKGLRSFRVRSWQEQAPGARTLLLRKRAHENEPSTRCDRLSR